MFMVNGMVVETMNTAGLCRMGSLPSTLTPEAIVAVLGEPNIKDDPYKVTMSWGFVIDGEPCGIWDYKGYRWSTYGPIQKIHALFNLDI